MADITILWQTARVAASKETGLGLTVELSSEPDSVWRSRLEERRRETTGREWWIDSPVHNKLSVGGLQPGQEAEVRAALDTIVEDANRDAESERVRGLEAQRAREADAAALNRTADEMTERFRSN